MEPTRLITPNSLWAAHTAIVAIVATWLGFGAARLGFGVLGVFLCCAAILSQALVPRFPVVALSTFVIAAGVLPRYGEDNMAMLTLGLLNWLAALGFIGWIAWLTHSRMRPPLSHFLLIAMLLFIAWGGLSLALAAPEYLEGTFSFKHHPQQYLQAAALMLIASTLLSDRPSARQLALLMCAIPIVRAALQTNEGVYLDADVAALAVIALPFALLGAGMPIRTWQKISLAMIAAELLRIVLVAQNRGAALGLALVIVTLWLSSRQKVRWLLAATPLMLIAALLIPPSYVDRFSVLWDSTASHPTASLDRATVEHRMKLWEAGIRIVRENPWFGVGAGNYPKALATYLPDSEGYATHNSLLSVAAESGLVGAVIFVILFAGAIALLRRVICTELPGQTRDMARMVQASLAGWVGVGLVISRQDMQLAYLLLGWAVALSVKRLPVEKSPLSGHAGRA
jgi:O-Antigen ligase